MKSKRKFYANNLLESLSMKKVIIYKFWSKVTKAAVFSALRRHEEFFVLFQRETLNASLSNQPVI